MTATTGLEVVARARVKDPLSSVRAARVVSAMGVATTQASWFLEAVRDRPGLTASELAALSAGDFDRYQANRRLADLCRLGLVSKGESRISEATGHLECTELAMVVNPKTGKHVPVRVSTGESHFLDCPNPARFSRKAGRRGV